MKLLFIQGGSRWKQDDQGGLYTDSNFSNSIWQRYRSYCDELTVILRKEETVYPREEAEKLFNPFDRSLADCRLLPDVYRPVRNAFSLSKRLRIRRVIDEEVRRADKIIIRSVGTYYTTTALRCARKYGKDHLVEVTGFAWESLWYHSLRGKLVAPFCEIQCRQLLRDVPCAVYVTEEALQKRYPCRGRSLGCSDVELRELSQPVLDKRLRSIEDGRDRRLVIGTAAFLDVGWKGQEYVIRALADLREQGLDAFEYELIGGGTGERLWALAEKLGVSDRVRILGALPHEKVFGWMDGLDIYIQSSFMEGICRSLVEAMSRACPVAASDVGGNYELVSAECLFPKGDAKALGAMLRQMMSRDVRRREAQRSFACAKRYEKRLLDEKRDKFYLEFMRN